MNNRIEIKLSENEWLPFYQHVQDTFLIEFLKTRRYIKRLTQDEIITGMIKCLKDWFAISPNHAGYIEKCGFGTIAAMVFQDEEAGKFFDERLTDEQKRAIAGLGKAA